MPALPTVWPLPDADDLRLDLLGLLAAVEAAPPVEAVDVLAAELARMLDATEVSLLIANLSGTAAVRMSHATSRGRATDGANERTESLPLDDSVHHRVLRARNSMSSRTAVSGGSLSRSPSAATPWASLSSRFRRGPMRARSTT